MKKEEDLGIIGVTGSSFELPDGLRIHMGGELADGLLKVIELPSGRLHRPEDPLTGEQSLPDVAWFEGLLRDGMLRRLTDANGLPVASASAPSIGGLTRAEVLKLDPYAEARQRVVLELMQRGIARSSPDLGEHLDAIWEGDLAERFGEKPSPATVRSWFDRCGSMVVDVADMMRMSGRTRRSKRIDPALEVIYAKAVAYFYAFRGHQVIDATAEATRLALEANVQRRAAGLSELSMPNRETMRRRIDAALCRETYAAKWGEDAARRKWDGGGKGLKTSRILQTCLMDDTVVDAITCLADGAVAGRPYLCAILDVHSRVCLGIVVSFTPPTVQTAAACLRQANRPKNVRPDRLAAHPVLGRLYGRPDEIITDDGTNYVSPAFGGLLMDLGIKHRLAAVGQPRHKAMIERFFRSLNTYLISKLPGATLDPSLMRKLHIDPSTEAVVTIDELRILIDEFLHLYHVSLHSGIGAQPALAWERSMRMHGRNVILDERRLDALSGVPMHGRRITANGGCRLFGLAFKASNMRERIMEPLAGLEPHATRLDATTACTATIVYDPENLAKIHVRVGADLVPLWCTDDAYAAGLSLWQHRQIQGFAKREALAFNTPTERLAARAELNRAIQEAFPDLGARERRAAARFLQTPSAPTGGPVVEFAEASPRHDGMGPVIEPDLGADHRDDATRPQSRPNRFEEKAPADDGADDADQPAPASTGGRSATHMAFDIPDDDDRMFEDLR